MRGRVVGVVLVSLLLGAGAGFGVAAHLDDGPRMVGAAVPLVAASPSSPVRTTAPFAWSYRVPRGWVPEPIAAGEVTWQPPPRPEGAFGMRVKLVGGRKTTEAMVEQKIDQLAEAVDDVVVELALDDLLGTALINVATKIGSWAGRGRFTTWLHVVAVNSARTTYRRMVRQAVPTDPAETTEGERPGALQRPDPRTTSVIAGTRLDLLDAMENLERDHPQYVEPLLLRDVYELPYDEIAGLLGLPLGTVKAQIHHGRKLVRPMLAADS